ncbi:MAG: monovalent cation/H(+) antiporter subunit G [Chloroflexia bacterium]|nr:monovalent cation/H(+) antiporter subunit G [Chloroflexia bacterium]
MTILEMLTIFFATVGVAFILLASFGVLRLPDLYTRVHAVGKAGTLGVIGVLFGVGFYFGSLLVLAKMLALIGFFLLTSPVAAHMVGRAAYLTKVKAMPSNAPDELAGRYDEQRRLL